MWEVVCGRWYVGDGMWEGAGCVQGWCVMDVLWALQGGKHSLIPANPSATAL